MASSSRTGTPLNFETIQALAAQAAGGRTLPTAVLTCVDEVEFRILSYLVRCRDTGFMVILPALEIVKGFLDKLFVDEEGVNLVMYREATVQLEDSRSRKFGSGKVLIADFGAECSEHFYKTPVLRGPTMRDLYRITVGESVAKPAAKSAQAAADQWIGEVADTDEGIQEYFSAGDVPEEVDPGCMPNGSRARCWGLRDCAAIAGQDCRVGSYADGISAASHCGSGAASCSATWPGSAVRVNSEGSWNRPIDHGQAEKSCRATASVSPEARRSKLLRRLRGNEALQSSKPAWSTRTSLDRSSIPVETHCTNC